jgi:putative PEP-CTERM system histidine kinase
MTLLNLAETLLLLASLGLAIALWIVPRFGPASRVVNAFVLPAFLCLTALSFLGQSGPESVQDLGLLAFTLLVFCGSGACCVSYIIDREDYKRYMRERWWLFLLLVGPSPVLAVLMRVYRLQFDAIVRPESIFLGRAGYVAAVYLLLISVVGLAKTEQILRSAEEHVRWEIKFLLLGIASSLAAIIYVVSRILLYTPDHAFLTIAALRVFEVIFFFSCLLIFKSWRRSTGRVRVGVSQGVVYSTITFLSVGAYLVGAGLFARWAGRWWTNTTSIEVVIFLLSIISLVAISLGTTFRDRTRRWIRRHFFSSRYDYRQFWMDATERVQSIESPVVAASAFAELIQIALGSLDISVWLRTGNSDRLRLVAARGAITDGRLPADITGVIHKLESLTEPAFVTELDMPSTTEWKNFVQRCRASLLVPLISAHRVIGVLTVAADRTGNPFDWETREFLRVMAAHFGGQFHKAELLATMVEAREVEAFQTFSTFLLHDLKNFASTLGMIAKNAARYQANPDFQADAFESILTISEKMKRVCNNLRTFSNRLAANRKLEDLNDVVRQVAQTFERNVGHHIELTLGTLPVVSLDREEISRVLQNLFMNAHEASPNGDIAVTTGCEPTGVAVSVHDEGPGISPEFLERGLFHPFQTTKPDGMGIGLYQSKKIVEAHDGKIEVDSRWGEGTLVRIILPLAQTNSDDAPVRSSEQLHSTQFASANKTS